MEVEGASLRLWEVVGVLRGGARLRALRRQQATRWAAAARAGWRWRADARRVAAWVGCWSRVAAGSLSMSRRQESELLLLHEPPAGGRERRHGSR